MARNLDHRPGPPGLPGGPCPERSPSPNPDPNARPQADLNNLIHQMAERVRRLGEDIASDLGRTPQGRHLIQDLRELAISIDEFHESLHNTRDPYQLRQAYTGIDQTWHHLKWQLTQPGVTSPAVGRAAGRVDELDAAIHQALDLRMYTPAYAPLPAGAPAVPTEFVEAQRLAVALEQRAQALAATVQAEMAGVPGADRLARDAARLAQACDAFNDSIRDGQTVDVIRTAFGSVAAVADRFETDLQAYKLPAPVDASWRSFAAAEVLLRQRLGLATPPPAVDMVLQPAGNGPSPVLALADQLNAQLDAFLAAFTPTVRVVPEGEWILADAQRLKAAAVAFREECGRGVDSYRLSQQFIAVEPVVEPASPPHQPDRQGTDRSEHPDRDADGRDLPAASPTAGHAGLPAHPRRCRAGRRPVRAFVHSRSVFQSDSQH